MRSSSSDIGRESLPYGSTSRLEETAEEELRIEDHTVAAKELTGTGKTAQRPKPLNAAAAAC